MVGGFVLRKSSTGSTTPRPSRWNQMRLAAARAKYGFSGAVSQRANGAAPIGLRAGRCRAGQASPSATWPVRGWTTLGITLGEDRFFLVVDLDEEGPVAILHTGEERGEAVVVVLGPVLAGVVVALRAAASALP